MWDSDCDRLLELGKSGILSTDPEYGRDMSETIGVLEWAVQSHTDVDVDTLLFGDGTLWNLKSKLMMVIVESNPITGTRESGYVIKPFGISIWRTGNTLLAEEYTPHGYYIALVLSLISYLVINMPLP